MVRFRFIRHIRLGHFAQALELAEKMSARQGALGGPEGTHWVGLGGPANTLITEMEFPSLASMEEYQGKTDTDAEHVSLRRQGAEHIVEGSARIEIIQTAPHIARDKSVPL